MRLRQLFFIPVFLTFSCMGGNYALAENVNVIQARSVDTRPVVAASNAARAWLSYYKNEQKNVNYKTISSFVQSHPDFPAMDKLRRVAEKAMPPSLTDKETLTWFGQNPPQSSFGMKMYAGALMRAGQNQKAHHEINEWWKKANLSPDEQRDAYGAFSKSMDNISYSCRLRRLVHERQYTNARSLAKTMGTDYIALTEARIALQSGRQDVNAYVARVPQRLQKDEGFLFDRLKWRRKADNNTGAIEILNVQPAYDDLYDAEEWGKERGILARRLFEEGKFAAAYRLSANHKIKEGPGFAANEWMAGWLALEYLNKKWDAFEHFERLYHNVETPISRSRAAYWAGLSSEKLNHPEIARQWYEEAAKFPTSFYGQLSFAKLGRTDNIKNIAVSSSGLKDSPLGKSAAWLRENGYKAEAGLFLNKMIELAKTPQDFAAVASLANELSMKNLAIKAAQESEKKTGTIMVGYAFPKIESYIKNKNVEWALVHALVRQESRYDGEAVSSAGARGLMQLMPGTAKEVARKAGLSHDTGWLTSKPSHNVDLGTRYLQKLLDKYNGSYPMALAAYNAGPARVDRWVSEIGDPRASKTDTINWIEKIPIYETRNYVQRVLEGVYVYRQILSNNPGKPKDDYAHVAGR